MKKIIIAIVGLLLLVGVVQAKQLWEYDTFNNRANTAVEAGIVAKYSNYVGSYEQNEQLLDYYENLGGEEMLGSTKPFAGSTYNLAGAGIASSDTSLTLSSLTIKQTDQKISDSDLSDTFYVTVDPGNNTRQEILACTTVVQNSNGSATLSGCSRGMSPISPYNASSTLAFTHGGGSQVIFSDPPQLWAEFTGKSNDEQITGTWGFSSVPTSSDVCSVGTEFCNKTYIDSSVNQGAATSTESVGGIIELATQIEMASSTPWTAVDPHVIQSQYATSTPADGDTGLYVVVSENDGYLNQGWLDLTEDYAWTGVNAQSKLTISNATTTGVLVIGATTLENATSTLNVIGDTYLLGNATTTGSFNIDGDLTVDGTCDGCSIVATSTDTIALDVDAGDTTTLTVNCSSGYVITGGGYSGINRGATNGDAEHMVEASYPISSTAWRVDVYCNTGCDAGTLEVTAICIKP